MSRRLTSSALGLLASAAVIASGCGSAGTTAAPDQATSTTALEAGVAREADPVVATTAPPVTTSTTEAPATTVVAEPLSEDDLARFLAAAEATLGGSDAAGTVLADPEFHVALGQFFCAELDRGQTVGQVFVVQLADVAVEDRVDEARLLGGVLGAAVATMCPRHDDEI